MGNEILCYIFSPVIREKILCIMLPVLSKTTFNVFLNNINLRLGRELLCN